MERSIQWRRFVRWLPAPFILAGAVFVAGTEFDRHAFGLGTDAHIYYRGAVAWLHGVDPWSAVYHRYHFTAPPWALVPIAPFTVLNEAHFAGLLIVLNAVAAAYIVRRSGLSWLWLLFPPLVQGTLNGNPAVISIALLLAGAGPIGVLLRPQIAYVLVGERRWRAVAASAVLGILLIAVLPLHTFLADLPAITARYVIESRGGSTGGSVIALVIGIISVLGLATIDLREAGWLATIVAVPINGWYASAAALPFMSPILALGLALRIVGMPTAIIAVYVGIRLAIHRAPPWRISRVLAQLVEPYRGARTSAEPDGQDADSELPRTLTESSLGS